MFLNIYYNLLSEEILSEEETKLLVKHILAIMKTFSKKNQIRINFSEACLDILRSLFDDFTNWKKQNYLRVTSEHEAHFVIYTFIISFLKREYYEAISKRAANSEF